MRASNRVTLGMEQSEALAKQRQKAFVIGVVLFKVDAERFPDQKHKNYFYSQTICITIHAPHESTNIRNKISNCNA